MSLSGMKIQASRTGVMQKVTFNLKRLSKRKPELAEFIENIADGERALKNLDGPFINFDEFKKEQEKKRGIKL